MAAGDLASRKFLLKAGFSMEEAMEMTLVNEPWDKTIKKLVNMRRGTGNSITGPLFSLMLPFVRTPANILEQGIMKIPGFGALYRHSLEKGGKAAVSTREMFVEQSIGATMFMSGYFVGLNAPDTHITDVRRVLTNTSGQYSLLSGLGFAAGQGARKNNTGLLGGLASREMSRGAEYAFPLPVFDTIAGMHDFATREGAPPPPGALPQILLPFVDRSAVGRYSPSRSTSGSNTRTRYRRRNTN